MAKITYRQMLAPRELSQQIPALRGKSPRVGANFWCKSPEVRGGWLWMKLMSALLNPINGGGGLFGPGPENKVTVIGSIWNLLPIMVRMILVNMQNLKLLAVLILEIWRHKNFLSSRGTSHRDLIYTPGIDKNSTKKSPFMPQNIFSGKIVPRSAFPWFSSKTKRFICSSFSCRRLISKTTAATPWQINFVEILPKCA